jgi:hypothetical protein
MARLFNEIPKMLKRLSMISQYNNFRQLGAEDDITYLHEKITDLYDMKDNTELLIKEFNYCAKMINMYYDEIDSDFKKKTLEEDEFKEEFKEI